MGKTGFYGLFPCRGSTVNNFCFARSPKKSQKRHFFEPLIAKVIVEALNYIRIQKVEYLDENSGLNEIVDLSLKDCS